MFLCELVEVIAQHVDGHFHAFAISLLTVQLVEQAFLQVAGGDAGRIELLDLSDQGFNFFLRRFDVLAESQVIDDREVVSRRK